MILIMGYGDVFMVVEVMWVGVYDFVEKLFDFDYIVEVVKWVVGWCGLVFENCVLCI